MLDQKFELFLAAIQMIVKILMAHIVMQTYSYVYVNLIILSPIPNSVIKVLNLHVGESYHMHLACIIILLLTDKAHIIR